MDRITQLSAQTALRQMFKPDKWLNICLLDQLIAVARVVPPREEYQAVKLLHCVSWRDMAPELRDATVARILAWFDLPAWDPFAPPPCEVTAATHPTPTILGRLLGRGGDAQ